MADKRANARVDYKELNNRCSLDIFPENNRRRRKLKTKVFNVERVISKKVGKKVRTFFYKNLIANVSFNTYSIYLYFDIALKVTYLSAYLAGQGTEYLIKWKGWTLWTCSWEPEEHLNNLAVRYKLM